MARNYKKDQSERPRKTETIKERSIYVYLPDKAMTEEWKNLARETGQSISKFVVERVEDSLRNNGDGPRHSRKDLIDRVRDLEMQLAAAQEDLTIKSRAYVALESELQSLRVQPFLNPGSSGVRQYNKDLMELFKRKKRITYDELLPSLRIKPTDVEQVTAINNQIELLVSLGLVKVDLRGWRWTV